MRKIINVALAIYCVMSSCFSVEAQQISEIVKEVVIPDGTEFSAVSTDTISSRTVVAGTILKFEVYEDVKVNGVTVIKEGTIVKGYVFDAIRARKGGRRGNLVISIESTTTVDNQPIKLRSVKKQEGRNRKGAVIGLGFLIGPFALLKHGTDAEIIKGTKFQVYTYEQKIVHIGDSHSIIPSAIKQDSNIKADEKPDLYNELLKLKELKDKGILTEEEFEAKKKEILIRD